VLHLVNLAISWHGIQSSRRGYAQIAGSLLSIRGRSREKGPCQHLHERSEKVACISKTTENNADPCGYISSKVSSSSFMPLRLAHRRTNDNAAMMPPTTKPALMHNPTSHADVRTQWVMAEKM